jgi:hypothetical protein
MEQENMMKILQVERASELLYARQQLREHMDAEYSGLTAKGGHFDRHMVEALAGQYASVLRTRLTAIEQELVGLGVDLNSPVAVPSAPIG